jgi:hypothetical protein
VNGTIRWSPTGHAYSMPFNGQNYSVHYDGDRILFITDASGALWLAKLETLANYSGGSLQVVDRDVSGRYASKHNATFYGGAMLGSTIYKNKDQPADTIPQIFWGSTNDPLCGPRSGSTSAACAPAGNFEYDRLEGFEYFGLTMQGARAVDESTGKWTTPDAYAGNVHDPMSQKSFMWDNNNPYAYSDPSGYAPNRIEDCGGCAMHGYQSMDAANRQAKEQRELAGLFDEGEKVVELIKKLLRAGEAAYGEAGEFTSESKLLQKFKAHGSEVGATSEALYVGKARDLLNRGVWGRQGTEMVMDVGENGGHALKIYDASLGRIGIYTTKGGILNYYAMTQKAWDALTQGLVKIRAYPPLRDM